MILTGGHAMFLGSQDIQLGVNESLLDTSKVVSSMVDGIMARVGAHSEIEVWLLIFVDATPMMISFNHMEIKSTHSLPFPTLHVDLGQVLDRTHHQRLIRSLSPNPDLSRSDDPA